MIPYGLLKKKYHKLQVPADTLDNSKTNKCVNIYFNDL